VEMQQIHVPVMRIVRIIFGGATKAEGTSKEHGAV